MPNRPRVLLADDHEDFLARVRRLLEPELDVVRTVHDERAAFEQASLINGHCRHFQLARHRDLQGAL